MSKRKSEAVVEATGEVKVNRARALSGTLVHCPTMVSSEVFVIEKGLVVIDEHGKIAGVFDGKTERGVSDFNACRAKHFVGVGEGELEDIGVGRVLMPGFVDCHCHAPQYSYTGTHTDTELMEWLEKYTFPAERRMADVNVARVIYDKLVRCLLRNGTTTVMYFATIHVEATKALADICNTLGQRAFVGKVLMDRNGVEGYQETTEESLAGCEEIIEHCSRASGDLVRPVLTPRFLPTCSPELLTRLGQMARGKEGGIVIQSHISESDGQVAFVAHLAEVEQRASR